MKKIAVILILVILYSCQSAGKNAKSEPESMRNKDISYKTTTSENYVDKKKVVQTNQETTQKTTAVNTDVKADTTSGDKYQKYEENSFIKVIENSISTFGIDVDTGSYSIIRNHINNNNSVPEDAVRIEEMINYFDYEYKNPENIPFSVSTEIGPSIFSNDRYILKVGIQGKKKTFDKTPPLNLVFVVDVSGSMNDVNKLPLLKEALTLLISQLRQEDTVSIITYAGGVGNLLEPTNGLEKGKIIKALESMQASGSTNGEGGIKTAYEFAKNNLNKSGVNRIILCTDGDFNVGISSFEELKKYVAKEKESGVYLTTIGFGQGNFNDVLMEQLADAGNGNYFFIDNINEAKKVLFNDLTSNMEVIAKDVKVQIEFNKEYIQYYRLIGYENRILNKEDFNNDKIDSGDIGSGHTVTALYEIVFINSKNKPVDDLRYGEKIEMNENINEIAFVKLRYKNPTENESKLVDFPVYKNSIIKEIDNTSNNFRFALSVAGFGHILKNSKYSGNVTIESIVKFAKESKGSDEFGYKSEFIELIEKYKKTNIK